MEFLLLRLSPLILSFKIWAFKAYFCSYAPCKIPVRWICHDHTDFGPQIPFLVSGSLYSPFWALLV
jgi:hypothetical protein